MNNAMIVTLLVGLLVMGGVFALLIAFLRKGDESKASERLDLLVGRNTRKDSSSDMLLKQALQEVDKKTILDKLTPKGLNLTRSIEQADANVQPSALVGVALGAAGFGALASALAREHLRRSPSAGSCAASVPFLWLWWKRKSRLGRFADQLPDAMELTARALRAGHSLAAGMHVVAEEMPAADHQGVRPGVRGAEPGHLARRRLQGLVRAGAEPGPAVLRHERRDPAADRGRPGGNPRPDRAT